jgi:hypothetical protein
VDEAVAQDVPRVQLEADERGEENAPLMPHLIPHFTHEEVQQQGLLTTSQVAAAVQRESRSILNWVSAKGLLPAGSVMLNKTRTYVFRLDDVRTFMRAHGYEGRWTRHKAKEAESGERRAESGAVAGIVVGDDVVHAARVVGSVVAGGEQGASLGESDSEGDVTAEMLLGKGGVDAYALLEAAVQQIVPLLNKKLGEGTSPHELKQHSSSIASLLEQIKRLQLQVEKQAQRSGDVVPLAVAGEIVTRFCQATVSACEVLQRELVLAIMEQISPRLHAEQDASLVRREVTLAVETAVRVLRERVTQGVADSVHGMGTQSGSDGGEGKHAA